MVTLARMLLWLLSRVPDRWLARWTPRLGRMYLALSKRARRVTTRNLAAAYPKRELQEILRMADESAGHVVRGVVEAGRQWFWDEQRLRAQVNDVHGFEHLETRPGQGLLFIVPHFGAWELMGLYMQQTHDIAILYKPPSHAGLNREIQRRRARFGATVVPATGKGLRTLLTHLKAGKAAAVLPDQRPKAGDGRIAPFFGIPTLTGVLVPRLLQRTGAHAVFMGCRRDGPGHYSIHVIPAESELYSEDMDTALAALNRGVERVVALDPVQYLWTYKRFKTEPGRHSAFYDD